MMSVENEMMSVEMSAPDGTSGLVCEPWTPGEVYGVAADWAQAAAPVYTYGPHGWERGLYQVADFGHDAREAMECVLRLALLACHADEEEAVGLLDDAVEF